jgi:hypothetical protein
VQAWRQDRPTIKPIKFRYSSMKFFVPLFALFLATACKPYKVTTSNYEIPLTNYSQIDNPSNRLKSFADLPRRIKNIHEFKDQAVTTDSTYFNNSPQTTSLFLYGSYDKKSKVGYVIQRFYTADKKSSNQCTMFIVRDDSLTFDFFSTPKDAFLWADIKPYLHRANDKLFGGGIAVFKTKKQRKK